NGQQVTILAGQTSGSVNVPFAEDDVYLETDTVSATISGVASGGTEYEQLVINPAAAVTTITDDVDPVTATLTADVSSISETGGTIVYTVTLTGSPAPIAPQTGQPLTFTLANAETVTILAGQTTGSASQTYTDAEITNQANITNFIANVTGGAQYENLVTAGT